MKTASDIGTSLRALQSAVRSASAHMESLKASFSAASGRPWCELALLAQEGLLAMDVRRIPVIGDGTVPLTQKYEYFGSPPDVQMALTPAQIAGFTWLMLSAQIDQSLDMTVLRHRGGPWLEIETPNGSWAIWDTTGAVHEVDSAGAVVDPPLYVPPTEDEER